MEKKPSVYITRQNALKTLNLLMMCSLAAVALMNMEFDLVEAKSRGGSRGSRSRYTKIRRRSSGRSYGRSYGSYGYHYGSYGYTRYHGGGGGVIVGGGGFCFFLCVFLCLYACGCINKHDLEHHSSSSHHSETVIEVVEHHSE